MTRNTRLMGCLALTILTAAACGDATDSHSDLNDDEIPIEQSGWTVVANYDGYPNVAVRCFGADRVFTSTRQSNPMVIVPDAADCRDGGG